MKPKRDIRFAASVARTPTRSMYQLKQYLKSPQRVDAQCPACRIAKEKQPPTGTFNLAKFPKIFRLKVKNNLRQKLCLEGDDYSDFTLCADTLQPKQTWGFSRNASMVDSTTHWSSRRASLSRASADLAPIYIAVMHAASPYRSSLICCVYQVGRLSWKKRARLTIIFIQPVCALELMHRGEPVPL
jgi:hypothetical protein